jgi:hypothetical protein
MSWSEKIYSKIIKLYPPDFQDQHGFELQQTFEDITLEVGTAHAWAAVLPDFIFSTVTINVKYFFSAAPIQTALAISGMVLVLPFTLFFIATSIGNSFDLRMDNIIGQQIDAHIMLSKFLLFTLPLIALLLNIGPLLLSILTQKKFSQIYKSQFIRVNFLTLLMTAVSLGCLAVLYGHDLVPCLVHTITIQNIHNTKSIIQTCQNS